MAYAGLIRSIKDELQSCRDFASKALSDNTRDWTIEDELEHQMMNVGEWICYLPDTHNVHQMMQDRLAYLKATCGIISEAEAEREALSDKDQLVDHIAWMHQVLEILEKGDARPQIP